MAAARLAQPEDAETVAELLTEFRDWFGGDQVDDDSIRASVRRLIDDPQTEYLLAGEPPNGVCQLRYRHSV
ncbi:MAG TPA: hypothetical protein VFQ12_06385 [Thermoleophilaceae bacterium]|nr:hypothetical protein [Thermoleophilaceae bacterium]